MTSLPSSAKSARWWRSTAPSRSAAQETPGLTLLEGSARFVAPRELEVAGRRLRAERIFIATGLRPARPDLPGLDPRQALTSETLMELTEVPARLVLLGGGYVACELGQAFRRFGAAVVIVQRRRHLLPREEPAVSSALERAFEAAGIELLLQHRALRVEHAAGEVRLLVQPPRGPRRAVLGSHLLVATGRVPNTDTLELKRAGIATDRRGHVTASSGLRSNVPGIWAIGDVNGEQPFTRVCQEEAKVAYANAFEGRRLAIQRASLGHAVFTDPEVGSVGLTEAAARRQGLDVVVGVVRFDQVERARLIGETAGLLKYVVERGSRRVLGCHIVGPSAGELVYSVTPVIRRRGRIDEIARAVGIFPTLAEGVEGTARGVLRRLAPDRARGPLAAGRIN